MIYLHSIYAQRRNEYKEQVVIGMKLIYRLFTSLHSYSGRIHYPGEANTTGLVLAWL